MRRRAADQSAARAVAAGGGGGAARRPVMWCIVFHQRGRRRAPVRADRPRQTINDPR